MRLLVVNWGFFMCHSCWSGVGQPFVVYIEKHVFCFQKIIGRELTIFLKKTEMFLNLHGSTKVFLRTFQMELGPFPNSDMCCRAFVFCVFRFLHFDFYSFLATWLYNIEE